MFDPPRSSRYLSNVLKRLYRALPQGLRRIVDSCYEVAVQSLPKKAAIKLRYFKSYQRFPNLSEPERFSEKCQALKLAKLDLARFVDKVEVKQFVAERIGEKYVIPTLFSGAWLPEERNWRVPYVIKTNHGSGGNIFVREKPDWPVIEERLRRLLDYDFAAATLEGFYGGVKRKVLVEPFLSDGPELPLDYKFFFCDGEPQFIQVDTARENAHTRSFFDLDWNALPIRLEYNEPEAPVARPRKLHELADLAAKLARGFSFVRVDMYEISGAPYFGELTFAPASGLKRFEPESVDLELGRKWPWPPKWPDETTSEANRTT